MMWRRIVYLLALLGGLVFYWAYREWLSWFVLMLLVGLPWFSLLVSLPAMLTCQVQLSCPSVLTLGQRAGVSWQGHSPYPLPDLKGSISVRHSFTAGTKRLSSGDNLPAEHCGVLEVSVPRPKCCDYLGLWCLPLRSARTLRTVLRPVPIPMDRPPDMSRLQAGSWRPKPGGGFSENHELRLYRPGDSLRQVHWKLSAKTGKLITREPMEPLGKRILLTLELQGTGAQLDQKLGRLLWLSQYLLDCELPHQIQCLTGKGLVCRDIHCPEDILPAIDDLLRSPLAAADVQPVYTPAAWRCHIGGDTVGL